MLWFLFNFNFNIFTVRPTFFFFFYKTHISIMFFKTKVNDSDGDISWHPPPPLRLLKNMLKCLLNTENKEDMDHNFAYSV